MTMMIDITIATMGRLTKKRAMTTSPRLRRRGCGLGRAGSGGAGLATTVMPS